MTAVPPPVPPDWRRQVLPDGRVVEFVDAVPVMSMDGLLVVDVTMVIDGADVHQVRVEVPTNV